MIILSPSVRTSKGNAQFSASPSGVPPATPRQRRFIVSSIRLRSLRGSKRCIIIIIANSSLLVTVRGYDRLLPSVRPNRHQPPRDSHLGRVSDTFPYEPRTDRTL